MNRRRHLLLMPRLPTWAGASLLIALAVACGSGDASNIPRPTVSQVLSVTPPSAAVPTLTILSPHSGERVSAPVPIRYVVTGFVSGNTSLFVYLGGPGSSLEFELPLRAMSGVVYLEDQPMLSGKRTLTFQLAVDHQPLQNPEAQVILRDVVIEGKRGA
jgi:hypothetical protein